MFHIFLSKMVFSKRQIQKTLVYLSSYSHEHQHSVDEESCETSQPSQIPATTKEREKKLKPPLTNEVIYIGGETGKNMGGTKNWQYNHSKKHYKSTYTIIHYHFFGAPVGKPSGIQ